MTCFNGELYTKTNTKEKLDLTLKPYSQAGGIWAPTADGSRIIGEFPFLSYHTMRCTMQTMQTMQTLPKMQKIWTMQKMQTMQTMQTMPADNEDNAESTNNADNTYNKDFFYN